MDPLASHLISESEVPSLTLREEHMFSILGN